MTRVDTASRTVGAPAARVYAALVEADQLEAWLPPEGMSGRMERFDPRPGGGFRMVLTYLDPTGAPGKTSAAEDVVEVSFVDLAPGERVVQQAVFESDDPRWAGTMTMTWELGAHERGTHVVVSAVDVPPGIEQSDHETAMASSLANLSAYLERAGR